ncbi:MAG TPA: hypothetical protein PKJ51_12020 [Methanothrix sp.]|jgi:hypothetical protein|nr:hypothetical protein [Methanothrix sp.]
MDSKIVRFRAMAGGTYGSLTLPVVIQRALGNPRKFRVSLEDGAVVYRPIPVDDEGEG